MVYHWRSYSNVTFTIFILGLLFVNTNNRPNKKIVRVTLLWHYCNYHWRCQFSCARCDTLILIYMYMHVLDYLVINFKQHITIWFMKLLYFSISPNWKNARKKLETARFEPWTSRSTDKWLSTRLYNTWQLPTHLKIYTWFYMLPKKGGFVPFIL